MSRHAFALATTLAVLAGCSGSHAVPAPPSPQSSAGSANSTRATATVKILIPARTTSASQRRVQYVSPATQSIGISFIPAAGGTMIVDNVNLTLASNPNCAANLVSPEVCTITLSLPPGSFTASFTTYDGLLDGNGNPTGNVLSQNQSVPVTITVGGPNALNVALQGVPASVALIPAATATIGGSQAAGLTLSKCFANQSVTVIGLDADGNDILGPGAPTPALVSSDTTQLAVTAPSVSSPNTFTLTRPAIPNGNATITLTASVTPGTGGSPVSAPVSLTFDGTICGTFTEYVVSAGFIEPFKIAVGPDNALWFTNSNAGVIGRITTSGVSTLFTTSAGWDIVGGPDGAVWYTELNNNNIARITPAGAVTEFPAGPPGDGLRGITLGPDGALWFTVIGISGNAQIGRITTTGSVSLFSTPTLNCYPFFITPGPDGALWFTETYGNNIGRITTAGNITEYPIPTANADPEEIIAGPDGALWFTEFNTGSVGRITTSGVITEYPGGSQNFGLGAGPDGALWFDTWNGSTGTLDRLTTAGTVSASFTIPSASPAGGITTGPDGALWFTELDVEEIGRLQ